MEFFRTTHIDFLGKRFIFLALSGLLIIAAIWSLAGGINRGIDFAGGTEIQVKFGRSVAIDELRAHLEEHQLGDFSLQRIGLAEENEFLIRVGAADESGTVHAQEKTAAVAAEDALQADESLPSGDEGVSPLGEEGGLELETVLPPPTGGGLAAASANRTEQERVYDAVLAALRELRIGGAPAAAESRIDLNLAGAPELSKLLMERWPADARRLATGITEYRTTHAGLFTSFDELSQVNGMTADIRTFLEAGTYLGEFTIRRVEYVGPKVGKELAEKAYLAMVLALGGMLIYITVRFRQLGFAFGAILALIHDGIISAGIFNLWGGQFDLTIVAAILTLLGYSVNDTIVIFDRVRENMRAMRGAKLVDIFNTSINQTLSRTILTSLTTLLVVFCLYSFGGETLHGFAFVLMFGLLVGTYSTIFIASPVVIAYLGWMERRKTQAQASASRRSRPAGQSSGKRRAANR